MSATSEVAVIWTATSTALRFRINVVRKFGVHPASKLKTALRVGRYADHGFRGGFRPSGDNPTKSICTTGLKSENSGDHSHQCRVELFPLGGDLRFRWPRGKLPYWADLPRWRQFESKEALWTIFSAASGRT
jgi:hypothetical protein